MTNQKHKRIFNLGFALGIIGLLFAFSLVVANADEDTAQAEEDTAQAVEPEAPKKSPIKIGGAMRTNYVYGTYADPSRRGKELGDVDLEIFRLNADLDYNNVISRVEYRYYDGYGMMHTAWLGYKLGNLGTLKAGLVRKPFGPTAYGLSNSWFFDQHFYVGLADDMDLGVRWTNTFGQLTFDLAYYLQDSGDWDGESSLDSSRYDYDLVRWNETVDSDGTVKWGADEDGNGFEEQNQVNLRAIYAVDKIGEFGVSAEYGMLKGTGVDDDGAYHYAVSGHMKNTFAGFTLVSQFSYYKYNITDDTPWGTGDLIPMGGYDFAWPVAAEGMIPGVSLRYGGIDASKIPWIKFDSVTPYVEFSSILKTVEEFNPSSMAILGAAWGKGGWYIYTDLALSDGNFFVGNVDADGNGEGYGNIYTGPGDFGANGNNAWNARFNVNLGYYF